jgi:hypothetical protein
MLHVKSRANQEAPQFDKFGKCLSLSSDEESEFFATGVDSYVHDRSKK